MTDQGQINKNRANNVRSMTAKSIAKMTSGQKQCRYCSQPIGASAKVCYHCGRYQNRFRQYLRTEVIGVVVLLASIIIMSIAFYHFRTAKSERADVGNALEQARKAEHAASAALEQVTLDAKKTAQLKQQMEAQIAAVDSAASEASRAIGLSGKLSKKNDEIRSKFASLDSKIEEADEKLQQVRLINEFMMTVVATQTDDRKAFDRLKGWAEDDSFLLSRQAKQVWQKTFNEHCLFYMPGLKGKWLEGIEPFGLTLAELKGHYQSVESHLKPVIIDYILERKDFSEREKMGFLVDVLKNDDSIDAVEFAGRAFRKRTGLKGAALEVDYFVNWWEENKDSFK